MPSSVSIMPIGPMIRRTAVAALCVALGTPATADAQACLGLHPARRVPTAEVVSNFHRDGIAGPSTLGLSLTAGPLIAAVETAGDPSTGESALSGNGLAGTVGLGFRVGPISLCGGGSAARNELVSGESTSAEAVFGGVGLQLPSAFGMTFGAFGTVAQETRTMAPESATPVVSEGPVYRVGLFAYPRPWLGLRVYEDFLDLDYRLGFSVGLAVPLAGNDGDHDGVSDAADRCPTTPAGEAVDAKGCPRDADRDGVVDDRDKCPDTPAGVPVNAEGCPRDSDGDGVLDLQDKCPNTPAGMPVNAEGCPRDADGDGVLDAQDKCPGTPAGVPVNAEGCPRDSDGDGVYDLADKCPDTPPGVPVNADGCPRDADGDGVLDLQDKCPNTPAGVPVSTDGCPKDSDGDGVLDAYDRCPETPIGTPVNASGCPRDADGDGVLDTKDQCPNTPAGAPVDANGCSVDADGDGVPDVSDQCPYTPRGVQADANGCPGDRDRDRIADPVDACPNSAPDSPVDARGCPRLFAETATFTLTDLTFETSRAIIRPSSFDRLDEVATALVGNPDVRVEISGHTDNVGSDGSNQRLSQARAEAVRQYFIQRGVAANRMVARGFGETRPVATNETPAGRAQNRRVEMRRLP